MTGRLPPLPPGEWPAEMGDALAALRPENARSPQPRRRADRPKGLNVLGLLAHHPELAQAYNTLSGHLLYTSTLGPRERELLILRVAAKRRCEYEWLQHKVAGLDLGLSAEEIARVEAGPTASQWSPLEAALLRAVDELVAGARIEDETYAVLAEELSEQQLMDLVFTVGAYELMAMVMRTFDVVPDADLDPWK